MLTFEQNYECRFLESLLAILTNEVKLNEAMTGFQSGGASSKNEERYRCQNSFGLKEWDPIKAALFSAAISEAIHMTSIALFQQSTSETTNSLIAAVQSDIQTKIEPNLVSKVSKDNPLEELPAVINQRLTTLTLEVPSQPNPYSFFGGIALAGVVIAASLVVFNASR